MFGEGAKPKTSGSKSPDADKDVYCLGLKVTLQYGNKSPPPYAWSKPLIKDMMKVGGIFPMPQDVFLLTDDRAMIFYGSRSKNQGLSLTMADRM